MDGEDWIPVRVKVRDRNGKKYNTDALYDRIGIKLNHDVGGQIIDIWEDGLFGGSLMIPQDPKVPEGLK